MRLLEPEAPAATPRGLLLAAQILSLIFTGSFVWTVVSATPFFRNSPAAAIGRAVGFALAAWMWSAAMLAGLYLLFAEGIPDYRRRILRTSTAAVWFAPATILLAEQSAAAALAGLILVVNTTRVLYSEWRLAQPAPEPEPAPPEGPFQDFAVPSPVFSQRFAHAMALALIVQSGAAAAVMRYRLAAAGCFALGAAFLTASGMALGIFPLRRPRDFPHSVFGAVLTVLMAACLTLGVQTARGLLRDRVHGGETGAGAKAPGRPLADYELVRGPAKVGDNDFPGVILRPEVRKDVVTLVDPAPAGTGFSAEPAHPLGIPFSGEYWMFRRPFKRPPYGSFMERGSPAWRGFLTTDHAPLQMEAHHRLDEPIKVICCSKVQIAIWNGDRYPGTVWLELVLIDAGRLSQSLGTAAVTSSAGALPVRETLEFAIPGACAVERFNEFKVVFHRDRKRMDKSARIEIDRFVLVPAGRG